MLVVFPLGLLVMAFIFDGIALATRNGDWHQAAFWMIGAGLISGLLAAVPGIIDWVAIPIGTRAKSIGLFHGLGNIALIVLFTVAWLLRKSQLSPQEPGAMALAIEVVAVGLGVITAWLGGELVDRLGVGVDRGANLNAPNSLSGLTATETTESTAVTPSPSYPSRRS